MRARVDHVVLWVEEPLRAVEWYQRVVGLEGVRVEEYRAELVAFPGLRLAEDAIVDLMPKVAAPMVEMVSGTPRSAGHPVNHLCLALSESELDALLRRLQEHQVAVSQMMENSFGAQGEAKRAFYFSDPDGNVLEARHY